MGRNALIHEKTGRKTPIGRFYEKISKTDFVQRIVVCDGINARR